MRWIIVAAVLAGCGIKGDPLPVQEPEPEPVKTGLSISGTASIGVTTTIRN
ncbi:argininosuccinate lyase [Oceanibium sediminis]|uniref:argininosuccinate lyase n=1 Tax=Oceanibium sediminis TaxID=2026339 RepID=UPI000DD49180|nr:argininosuccinate lyase [Oceanibium sediminis]